MNLYAAALELAALAAIASHLPLQRLAGRVGEWLAQGRQVPRVAPTNARGPAVRTVQFVDGVSLGWCE